MVRVDRNIWFAVNSFSSLAAAVSNPREVGFRYSSTLLLVSSRVCQGLRAAPGQANGCPSLACWVILVLYLGFLCDDGEFYTWKGLISKYHHQFILMATTHHIWITKKQAQISTVRVTSTLWNSGAQNLKCSLQVWHLEYPLIEGRKEGVWNSPKGISLNASNEIGPWTPFAFCLQVEVLMHMTPFHSSSQTLEGRTNRHLLVQWQEEIGPTKPTIEFKNGWIITATSQGQSKLFTVAELSAKWKEITPGDENILLCMSRERSVTIGHLEAYHLCRRQISVARVPNTFIFKKQELKHPLRPPHNNAFIFYHSRSGINDTVSYNNTTLVHNNTGDHLEQSSFCKDQTPIY